MSSLSPFHRLFLAASIWYAPCAAAITWDLADLSGQRHQSLRVLRDHQATVLVFLAPGCTRSERARPLLASLHVTHHGRGIALFGVVSGRWPAASLGPDRFELPFPVLLDPALSLTRQAQARVTPEAIVLDRSGAVRYRGRLESQGEASPLRTALDELLSGRPIARPHVPAIGCAITAATEAKGQAPPRLYWRDVEPILRANCVECHQARGTAPFSLAGFDEAAPRAQAIADAVRLRSMPPWKPDPGPPHLVGERRLPLAQVRTLVEWAASGAREGPASRVLPPQSPAPAEWRLGPPDHLVTLRAPFAVPAGGPDLYRCFVLPAGLDRGRWVRAFEFRPGEARAVHHALIFVDHSRAARRRDAETPDEAGYPCFGVPGFLPSSALGGWAPGTGAVMYPEGSAVRLNQDADLVLQLHYAPGGEPRQDQSSVGLYFTETPPTRRMMDVALGSRAIDIPAGAAAYVVRDEFTLPIDVLATGIIPHAHFLARLMRGWAVLPDGRRINLLTIRDWDFNWQQQYRYREPFPLPAGTRLHMEFTYDNSAANPRNPLSPPRRVTWGPDSTDEMAGLHLQVTPVRAEDAEELGRALWGKLMREINLSRGAPGQGRQ